MAFSVAFSQALEITAYVNAKSQAQHEDYLSIQKISEMLNGSATPACRSVRFR